MGTPTGVFDDPVCPGGLGCLGYPDGLVGLDGRDGLGLGDTGGLGGPVRPGGFGGLRGPDGRAATGGL